MGACRKRRDENMPTLEKQNLKFLKLGDGEKTVSDDGVSVAKTLLHAGIMYIGCGYSIQLTCILRRKEKHGLSVRGIHAQPTCPISKFCDTCSLCKVYVLGLLENLHMQEIC